MAVSIGSLKYIVGADISDYTAKLAQLRAMRKTASKEEKLAIDKQIKLLREQQRKEKQILRDRSKAYNDFANTIRSSVKWISVGLVGVVATASKNLMDMERETKNLSAALSNLGLNNQGLLSTLTDLADQINEVTGINQQLINDAMAIGLQFGIAQDDIDEYAKALAALSSISGKSIQQLAQSLNQMYIKGDFSSLQKLGIYIDQNKSKQQQFNDVIAQGLEKYNELNNQTSDTLTRNMRVLGNVAGSVFEEIGKRINDNVIAPLAKWFSTNRELIINVTSKSADIVTSNWQHVLSTLFTLYSTFNKAVRTQTDATWSDIKTVITNNWKESGQQIASFRSKLGELYRDTKQVVNAASEYQKILSDHRRSVVVLNERYVMLNKIRGSLLSSNKSIIKIDKNLLNSNKTLSTTNKILLTTGKILLNNVAVVNTLRVAVLGVAAVAKLVNAAFRTTLVLAKSIGRALVVFAVMEAAIWAIEKAWDGVAWAMEKVSYYAKEMWDKILWVKRGVVDVFNYFTYQLGITEEKQDNVNKKVEEHAEKQKDVKEETKQTNDELEKQESIQQDIVNIVDDHRQQLAALLATTSDLNKSWDSILHPVKDINVLYKEYKDTLSKIKDIQGQIYNNQQNALIDDETKTKRNVELVTQYNNLLKQRNAIGQSLLSAKQKEQDERKKEAAAEEERVKRQQQEEKDLQTKRQQLKLQLEIAKAETAGNKDRAEALRIGQEVTNIAKEYKISIEDALKVYKTLNAEKNAGEEGYDSEGNKLTKAQLRRQKRAQENLKRYEESQAAAPGEKRKTGVRRISATQEVVERWRREAAGNFTGGDIKPVSERITANQIKANIPDASGITPITPSTDVISDQTQISTPQTTAGKSDNILNQIATKIDQMVSGFNTFTQQFSQTFSAN